MRIAVPIKKRHAIFLAKIAKFPEKREHSPLCTPSLPSVVDATLFGPLPDLQSDQRQAIDRGSTGSRGSFDPSLLEVGGQAMLFDPPLFPCVNT